MTRFTPIALAAAMLASSLAPAAPASAENAIYVVYRDLDLASPTGQATLARRLRRAADSLCDAGKRREMATLRVCRADVLADTMPSIQLAMRRNAVRQAMIESFTARALR